MQTGSGATETRGDPALVKALARAFRWRRMLEEGRYASVRELAKAEGVNRTDIGRLLNLTLRAPDIVEAILDGGKEPERTRLLEPASGAWAKQRDALDAGRAFSASGGPGPRFGRQPVAAQ